MAATKLFFGGIIMIWKLLIELVIGGLCGFAANKLMGGDSGSILKNVILGLVGGLVGGFLGNLIGLGGGWITGILLSIGGACLVVWLVRKFLK
jgi:uncharacterized membrane protein YeaQ/YmgE (transglycosylase-associated protein family)